MNSKHENVRANSMARRVALILIIICCALMLGIPDLSDARGGRGGGGGGRGGGGGGGRGGGGYSGGGGRARTVSGANRSSYGSGNRGLMRAVTAAGARAVDASAGGWRQPWRQRGRRGGGARQPGRQSGSGNSAARSGTAGRLAVTSDNGAEPDPRRGDRAANAPGASKRRQRRQRRHRWRLGWRLGLGWLLPPDRGRHRHWCSCRDDRRGNGLVLLFASAQLRIVLARRLLPLRQRLLPADLVGQ